MSKTNLKLIWLALALSVAILSRLVPHAPNWTAVGALALWGTTFFNQKSWALVLPLLALVISDLVLGFHSTMIWVYAGFLLVTLLGWILPANQGPKYWLTGSVLGGLVFFLVSNFGVWLTDGMYPMTGAGLVNCFVMAIPFLWNQISANIFFNAVFAAAYMLLQKSFSNRLVHF